MVQGKTKGLQNKGTSKRHVAKAASVKKGRRHVAPKKAILIKQASMTRSLTAKINQSIEAQMCSAASSGKLTIMKNGAVDNRASCKKQ